MAPNGLVERVRQRVRRAVARVTLADVVRVLALLARLAQVVARLYQAFHDGGGFSS